MPSLPSGNSAVTMVEAQREMRLAHYGGVPGMLTSATVWLVAGIVSLVGTSERAIWALFIGGMLISPVSRLLTKALGRTGKHSADNPLGTLALATTFWMILMMPLAYGVSRLHVEWFFPAMLLIIGGRYLTFSTIFGARIYWFWVERWPWPDSLWDDQMPRHRSARFPAPPSRLPLPSRSS